MIHRQMDSLNREIATLQDKQARERQKQVALLAKISRTTDAATRATSSTIVRTKLRELENAYKELAAVEKRLARFANQIADKSKRLHSYEERQARENQREQKKLAAERDRQARKSAEERRVVAEEQQRRIREREAHERRITAEVLKRAQFPQAPVIDPPTREQYDFFICHASEDKDGFVRRLAELLEAKGASVWYDEFTLNVGDSLRREIDRGLAGSRFGVVVLSESFFKKEWPQKELDGLVALETQGLSRILPIWHKVSVDEVAHYSPTLADKVALNTSIKSVEDIADDLLRPLKGVLDRPSLSAKDSNGTDLPMET